MLILNVRPILLAKGIEKPYTWLKKLGISHSTAHDILKKPNYKVSTKVLELICQRAWCTPSDLYEWTPNFPTDDKPTHPLQALKAKYTMNIAMLLRQLSPSELAAIEADVVKKINGEE